ncbi:MAG: hypothetical protein WC595_02115, partial [Candidatus Nanoarchaeia archaeon]
MIKKVVAEKFKQHRNLGWSFLALVLLLGIVLVLPGNSINSLTGAYAFVSVGQICHPAHEVEAGATSSPYTDSCNPSNTICANQNGEYRCVQKVTIWQACINDQHCFPSRSSAGRSVTSICRTGYGNTQTCMVTGLPSANMNVPCFHTDQCARGSCETVGARKVCVPNRVGEGSPCFLDSQCISYDPQVLPDACEGETNTPANSAIGRCRPRLVPPSIGAFTALTESQDANDITLPAARTVNLRWTASNTQGCTARSNPATSFTGRRDPSPPAETVNVQTSTRFTLSCQGLGPVNSQGIGRANEQREAHVCVRVGNIPCPAATAQAQPVQAQQETTWTYLANEGQSFTIQGVGPRTVRYGTGSQWAEKAVLASVQHPCTNTFFGRDPAVGISKTCQLQATSDQAPAPAQAQPLPSPTLTCTTFGIAARGQTGQQICDRYNLPNQNPYKCAMIVGLQTNQAYAQTPANCVTPQLSGSSTLPVFDPCTTIIPPVSYLNQQPCTPLQQAN